VENVEPGVYRITVETVNAQDIVTHVNSTLVEVRSVEDNPINIVPDGQGSGTAQFLQNILRAIFGN
jgi:predicted phage tail protein